MKLLLIVLLAVILIPVSYASADTYLAAVGDLGCKSTAKTNLNNIGRAQVPLLGAGDYLYGCSPSDVQKNWDTIKVKHGAVGNHDDESKSSYAFAKKIMGIGDKGWFSWRLGDIAIIGINQYQDYDKGSEQYNYIIAKSKQFSNRTDVNKIIYVFHEPIYTPTISGGHGPLKDFRDIYAPIIKSYKGFVIEAHNHATWLGTVDNIAQAGCGGGGQGGDKLGKLNGFEFGTTTFGYCLFHFEKDKTTVQLIGTDGTVKHTHIYN